MARIPPQIGKYKIVSLIAEGGMGAVYKAEHPTLNRYVALKRLVMRGSASFAERFRREARIMMDFKNDRIVDVYDHFKEKSSYYIVEEYVDGTSLDRLIRRERYLPNDIALAIFLECCRALKYAHDQGVIHRDIKPANILISRQGKVKLSDFGIATSQESDEEGLTRDGMTLGTLPYIAPEQIRNSRSVDKRADIYAMGAMLYEMVTGKPPFPRTFNPETLNRIQKGSYLAPTRLNPRIAPQARKIIKRCLKVNPRRRYQDLGEIVRFLTRYFRRWDPAAPREAIHRFIHRQEVGSIRRRRTRLLRWALAGLGVLALLAGAGYYLLLERGYYYEVIRAREYGALRVAARVQAGVKEPDRIFLQAALFQEAGEEVLPVEEARFRFTEREEPQGADSFTLESQKLYLKAGEYRIKVKLEDQLFWQSFYLAPRALQRQDVRTLEGRTIEVPPFSWPGRPFSVRFEIFDRSSMLEITGSSAVEVSWNEVWMPWNELPPDLLQSGASYLFRFQKDGYYPQSYNLAVDPFQSDLTIRVFLAPLPGIVRIVANQEGIALYLDDSRYYLSGGRSPAYERLAAAGPAPQTLLLPPGEYLLTAERSAAQSQSVRLRVAAGGSLTVSIDFNRATGVLNLSVQE